MWQPFGQVPPNGTAYWHEAPEGRGTFSILSSCVVTLSLCAYTSLHMNIPEYGKSYWRYLIWKKLWWVVLGITTPELVSIVVGSLSLLLRNSRSRTSLFASCFSRGTSRAI